LLASVGEDLAEDGLHFVQNQDFAGRLKNLKWFRQHIGVRHSIRQTTEAWTDDSRLAVLAKDFPGRWRKRLLARLEVCQDVYKIPGGRRFAQSEQTRPPGLCLDLPDSGKVGLAVHAGNWSCHIHLAIGRARSPGSRLVQPLRLHA